MEAKKTELFLWIFYGAISLCFFSSFTIVVESSVSRIASIVKYSTIITMDSDLN